MIAGRWFSSVCVAIGLVAVTGCGGGGGGSTTTTTTGPSKSARAAALSLQQAMDSSSRAIDDVRRSRTSLERLGASLQPTIAQTSDVIVLLTPQATGSGPEVRLLSAARQQRSFLQFASDAAGDNSRRAANSALVRARAAGRRASDTYAAITREDNELAGLLPASTTFNTGRLRDAVRAVTRKKPPSKSTGTSTGTSTGSSGSTSSPTAGASCGDGVSVNSVTTCPFARNVRDAYQSSGGASVIDVYSPVTGQTYTMNCTGGVPTVCRGGNNAVVYIR